MILRRLGLILFLYLQFNIATSQNSAQIKFFTGSRDLGNRMLKTMVEESPGQYWIGGRNGLQYFDGHTFWSLKEKLGYDPIGKVSIDALQIDKDNRLLIKYRNKAFTLDLDSYAFDEVQLPIRGKGEFIEIEVSESTIFYIIQHERIAKLYEWNGNNCHVIDSTEISNKISGYSIAVYDNVLVWSSGNFGCRVISKNSYDLLSHISDSKYDYPLANQSDSEILLVRGSDTYTLDPPNYSEPKKLFSVSVSKRGKPFRLFDGSYYWISDKLYRLNENGEVVEDVFEKYDFTPIGLKNIFLDSQDNTWLLTVEGLVLLHQTEKPFSVYHKSKEKGKINEFRAIFKSDNNLYSTREGVLNGIHILNLDSEDETFATIRDTSGIEMVNAKFSFPLIYDTRFDKFWAFEGEIGLGLLDPEVMQFQQVLSGVQGPFQTFSNGTIIIGNKLSSLQIYDPEANSTHSLTVTPNNEDLLGFINSYFEYGEDTLIIAGLDGLFMVNHNGKLIKHFHKESNPPLPGNNVLKLHKDIDGNLWGGTRGDGLFSLSSDLESVEIFNTENGLPNLDVPLVTSVGSRHIIAGTFDGLSIIDKVKGSVKNFFVEHGLSHNEFNTHSYYEDDSLLFFGTLNGINRIDQEVLLSKKDNPMLTFSRLAVYNNGLDSTIIYPNLAAINDALILKPDDLWFEIDVGISDFTNPDYNIYKYKIDGYHKNWNTIRGIGKFRFEGLPAGNYKLRIKGANASNVPCANEIEIDFQIQAVFYKTIWFFLLMGLSTLCFILYWFNHLKGEKVKLESTVAERTKELVEDKAIIENQKEHINELAELKNQFFANISHELRTPLTLLLSPLQHVSKSNNLTAEQIELIKLMKDNGEALKERIDEMFELSRLSNRKVSLSLSQFKLADLINRSVNVFNPLAKDLGIDFYCTQENTEIKIEGDSKKLSKIFQNLISNAIKFTKKGGSVVCSFVYDEQELEVQVKDTGIGIPSKEIVNIFDRFYQSKYDNSVANPGTGIGLSMVKEYVELMDGRVSVDSRLNIGSTFHLYIPLTAVKPAKKTEELTLSENNVGQQLPAVHAERPRLLVVEDNRDLRRYILLLLEDEFNIIEAADGLKAIELLNHQKIDIILSDIMMPHMDGITLLETVRSQTQFKVIPFVFLSAKQNYADVLDAYKIGVDDYLKKPFQPEELLCRIKSVYSNYIMRLSYTEELTKPMEVPLGNAGIIDEYSFIDKLNLLILNNLNAYDYSIEKLASNLDISSRQLIRIVKKEVGMTPNNYIREVKLNKARSLYESKKILDIDKLSSYIGFSTTRYFKKLYYDRFGVKL